MHKIKRYFSNQNGATAIEYSLIAAAVAVAIITAVFLAGDNVGQLFDQVGAALGGS